jgi:hypothetical protein
VPRWLVQDAFEKLEKKRRRPYQTSDQKQPDRDFFVVSDEPPQPKPSGAKSHSDGQGRDDGKIDAEPVQDKARKKPSR